MERREGGIGETTGVETSVESEHRNEFLEGKSLFRGFSEGRMRRMMGRTATSSMVERMRSKEPAWEAAKSLEVVLMKCFAPI